MRTSIKSALGKYPSYYLDNPDGEDQGEGEGE